MKKFTINIAGIFLVFILSGINAPVAATQISPKKQVSYRSDCIPAQASVNLEISNVRIRLSIGSYWSGFAMIGPEFQSGGSNSGFQAIYAANLWMGGYDPFNNLKVAANTFRSSTSNDFWPGPINPETNDTEQEVCRQWDKIFKVSGPNIETHKSRFSQAQNAGVEYRIEDIPADVLGWPGVGNPYFESVHEFSIPSYVSHLAPFYDVNNDGIYDPKQGDFPHNYLGPYAEKHNLYAKQEMAFSISNDIGNIHTSSRGFPIGAEIRRLTYAFDTDNDLKNMVFFNTKITNQGTDLIKDFYAGIWADSEISCATFNDFIGFDIGRNMTYTYVGDGFMNPQQCECSGLGQDCTLMPVAGMRMYRGFRKEQDTSSSQVSSFIYYNNGGIGGSSPAMNDPSQAIEYYRYLTGVWRDGTPLTYGGTGFNPGSIDITKYAYSSNPASTNPESWSMCHDSTAFSDRRLLTSTGPITLAPGEINDFTFGTIVTLLPNTGCPDISPFLEDSDAGELLFDLDYNFKEPDAPTVTALEEDMSVILILSNDTSSNNFKEMYSATDFQAPMEFGDVRYSFEGYKVFQLSGPDVTAEELNNPSRARLAFQTDIQNNIVKIYNWEQVPDPTNQANIYIPHLMVEGQNRGIYHTLKVEKDLFDPGQGPLINNKQYYFAAVAYAHNNYKPFNASTGLGQKTAYIESILINPISVIPRPSGNQNTMYGDGFEVTRLAGKGNPGVFLEADTSLYSRVLNNNFDGEILYQPGRGPVLAKIVDPEKIPDATLELVLYNEDPNIETVSENTRWRIENKTTGEIIESDFNLSSLREQLIEEYGISITMDLGYSPAGVSSNPRSDELNGAVGSRYTYKDASGPQWLDALRDSEETFGVFPNAIQPFNYIKNAEVEPDFLLDPTRKLEYAGQKIFVPALLSDYRVSTQGFLLSPMILNNDFGATLRNRVKPGELNNVDIIFTSDKSKWSRSVVIQTANQHHFDDGLVTDDNTKQFDARSTPSINKNGVYATSDGTINGTPLTVSSDNPDDPNYINPTGMGWFPGYAIDIETGERVNIFFGENSLYNTSFEDLYVNGQGPGNDMVWNPGSQKFISPDLSGLKINYFAGAQHSIYVTSQAYDGCSFIRGRLDPSNNLLFKRPAFDVLSWTCIPMLKEGTQLLSLEQGLIPNELRVQLRTNQPYKSTNRANQMSGMPRYRIVLGKTGSTVSINPAKELAGNAKLFPNPYYPGLHGHILNLQFKGLPSNCELSLIDMRGRTLALTNLKNIDPDQFNWETGAAQLAPGLYFIRVAQNNRTQQILKLLIME
jgi:hypothetical protein